MSSISKGALSTAADVAEVSDGRRGRDLPGWAIADSFASEHVRVLTANPRDALIAMRDYGALFLGEGTCVSYGDAH